MHEPIRITFFGTTTLLFDDGRDQVFFDAHMTRLALLKYICGSDVTNTGLVEEMLAMHHVDRLHAPFISHAHHDDVMGEPFIANRTGAKLYGSGSALNVARGGDAPEAQPVQFQPNETYCVGGLSVRVIPSVHSKPTILNNDLGQTVDAPLRQPARPCDYKEGCSYDFYVEGEGKRFMIRPSFNYIEGQMDGYRADVLFLDVAGLQKAEPAMEAAFYRETTEKVEPKLVIPVHWDNFFSALT